uniref:Photosystem II reaction center protein M n=1 Tax=Cycas apoa TaxID=1115355 RepID=A0A8K1JLF9_9SPER|nr:photosystem II protein M [Cycas apoa]
MLYSFPLSNSLDPSDFAIQIDSIRPISYSRDSINYIYGSLKGIHHLYEIKSRVIVERSENDKITEVNILAFIAIVLFISVPTAFLLIIYVKTVSESN